VVAEQADDVAIMYAGRIVEQAPTLQLFETPRHPYTQALLRSMPVLGRHRDRLAAIPGQVPGLLALPSGCTFRDRCPEAEARCAAGRPPLDERSPGHRVACVKA
jgi:oligopeptide/dipeptide ABC transporter ATP-binding protein